MHIQIIHSHSAYDCLTHLTMVTLWSICLNLAVTVRFFYFSYCHYTAEQTEQIFPISFRLAFFLLPLLWGRHKILVLQTVSPVNLMVPKISLYKNVSNTAMRWINISLCPSHLISHLCVKLKNRFKFYFSAFRSTSRTHKWLLRLNVFMLWPHELIGVVWQWFKEYDSYFFHRDSIQNIDNKLKKWCQCLLLQNTDT